MYCCHRFTANCILYILYIHVYVCVCYIRIYTTYLVYCHRYTANCMYCTYVRTYYIHYLLYVLSHINCQLYVLYIYTYIYILCVCLCYVRIYTTYRVYCCHRFTANCMYYTYMRTCIMCVCVCVLYTPPTMCTMTYSLLAVCIVHMYIRTIYTIYCVYYDIFTASCMYCTYVRTYYIHHLLCVLSHINC